MNEFSRHPEMLGAEQPETERTEKRRLSPEEKEQEENELREHLELVRAALQDPDLTDEDREELEMQLELLGESLDESEAGGDWFKEK